MRDDTNHDTTVTDLEHELSQLGSTPPPTLLRNTVVGVGAADEVSTIDSPIGPVWVAWNPRGVTAVSPVFATATFDDFAAIHRRTAYASKALPRDLAGEVTESLDTGMTKVPLDLSGIGAFQRQVLTACATSPVGQVRPYGWIASEIGNPGSVRAVGTALGNNPIPLLIPCHRVVRADGSVGAYAFGVEIKHDLLVREGAILA